MEELKQAVVAEPAPAEAPEVVNETVTDQPSETTQPVTETATPPAGQPTYEAVDEFGVPYKNRTFEWKRKYEDTIDRLPTMIEEAVKGSIQQYGSPKEKEHTISELEQFAQQSPEYRPWVEEQKAQLLRKQISGEFEQKIKAVETQKMGEVKRQQSFNYVASTYPEVFVKDAQGQVAGFNQQNPMAFEINRMLRDPRLANDPEGWSIAADIAYARVSRLKQGENLVKEQKLKAEVKHLQKQTLVEGGARQPVQAVPEYRKAIDRAKQSGSIRDVAEALGAISKAKRESMEK